ncbi:MAG: hypothetical protein R3C68_05040 [Myxococcota bacterium]
MTFATGRISDVLGGAYAPIDRHPTRVRLPDEPLMLVDRIVHIEGTPLTLGPGRIVAEHDVLPNMVPRRRPHPHRHRRRGHSRKSTFFFRRFWASILRPRAFTCTAYWTTVVTFHDALPVVSRPGIHFDIPYRSFFQTKRFLVLHFRFDATVGDKLLLTMRDGCAGFFTDARLAAGAGSRAPATRTANAVHRLNFIMAAADQLARRSSRRRRPRSSAPWRPPSHLPDLLVQRPRGLPILTIPGDMMRLVHRVDTVEPTGGEYGRGRIVASADIDPTDWFLTCHFIDDRVMPGTLMYEYCLHTGFSDRMLWLGR